jgi:hypothetical protein
MQLPLSNPLNWLLLAWQSQSLFAQLARWTLALGLTLVSVHHCQPLLDVMAEQAMAAGCHQHDVIDSNQAFDSKSILDSHAGMHHHHH